MAAVDLNIPPAPVVAGLTHLHSGKVRDLYRIDTGHDAGKLLMVASDRVSAFDFVLEPTIPDKGKILTRMSLWWFDQLADLVPNHVVSADLPDALPAHIAAEFAGRALVCEPLEMYPVECVARGYLTGSGLIDYQRTGEVCGVPLPAGLVDGDRLPEPIFTPATKAELGDHDENVSYDAVAATVGDDTAAELRTVTLAVYRRAEEIARERGLILADTKFEFGRAGVSTGSTAEGAGSTAGVSTGSTAEGVGSTAGRGLVLGDEVLTPDSSRYWPAAEWQPGRTQPSYDKQIVRNWLLSDEAAWDRASGARPPALPDHIVERTRARYLQAFELLTGESW